MGLTIGVWVCALFAASCTVAVVLLLVESRRAGIAVLRAFNHLSKTHRLGFEVLGNDLDRLRQRVLDLEAKMRSDRARGF